MSSNYPHKEFPEPVKKIIMKHFREKGDEWRVRKLLRRHYKEHAGITDSQIHRIANNRQALPPQDDEPIPPRPITLAGPAWSWPQNQGVTT